MSLLAEWVFPHKEERLYACGVQSLFLDFLRVFLYKFTFFAKKPFFPVDFRV